MDQVATPFYTDLKFWSLIISILALVLSQLKFFMNLFRRARLRVEPYSQIFVTHKYGNPNLQIHLILSNTGGRKIRVKGIVATVSRSKSETFAINAATYQKQDDPATLLFTPFSLEPSDEWAHLVNFWNPLPRQDDKRIKEARSALRADIRQKAEKRTEEEKERKVVVFADESLVLPFRQLFQKQFIWCPGEYDLALTIDTEPASAVNEQRYRFVLFESDTAEMENIVEHYPTGAGVFFPSEIDEGVIVPIQKT